MSSSNLVFKTWHGATSEETGTTTILPRSLQNLANNDEASLPARSPSHKRSLLDCHDHLKSMQNPTS